MVPILLLVVLGLFEFGRFVVTQSTINNASREAARYATTTGVGTSSGPRYADCDGMRDAAQEHAVFTEPGDGQITMEYDEGPGTAVFLNCSSGTVDPALIETGDRIIATVAIPYQPIIPLIGEFLESTTISAQTTRTINKG